MHLCTIEPLCRARFCQAIASKREDETETRARSRRLITNPRARRIKRRVLPSLTKKPLIIQGYFLGGPYQNIYKITQFTLTLKTLKQGTLKFTMTCHRCRLCA